MSTLKLLKYIVILYKKGQVWADKLDLFYTQIVLWNIKRHHKVIAIGG